VSSRSTRLLRSRDGSGSRVTFIELFFDLVYVFAVTQLSTHLSHHLTLGGAFETLLLLVAVWWAWIDTAWVTNWFDPDPSGGADPAARRHAGEPGDVGGAGRCVQR
jgi:low temperature requirement protein LtrA